MRKDSISKDDMVPSETSTTNCHLPTVLGFVAGVRCKKSGDVEIA